MLRSFLTSLSTLSALRPLSPLTAPRQLAVEAIQKDPEFYDAQAQRICGQLPASDVERCRTYVDLTIKVAQRALSSPAP